MTTKILALVDSLVNLIKFRLMPEQYHDIAGLMPLIKDIGCKALLGEIAYILPVYVQVTTFD
ncbi:MULTISPECIES: hypothetical protein [Acinetobacter]|uniref:Uncharacterized protein n=1 Tax=Acinetobacter corruptisaponis TaxID=3045147 RepID=A0ABY8S8S6_9GAMM|nr:hypothetical protein [Acinetobacter sp. KCTC 92772]WHP06099.1 hypothetical protein QLH32_01060 [Acinetobacter sp. KCTC 92772]